jgi:outer membrane immunogenic protein
MRTLTRCVASTFLAALLLQPAFAEKTVAGAAAPSATLELESEQMRLIYGGTAGRGVLHFEGKDYPFTFKSASAGLGAKAVTSVKAVGTVTGLKRIEDFEGKYNAVSKGVIAGASQVRARYSNGKGVAIELAGTVKGAGLSLGAGTATIKLVKE